MSNTQTNKLEKLVTVIRNNMQNTKLSEKSDPVEIQIKVTYPECALQHTFKYELETHNQKGAETMTDEQDRKAEFVKRELSDLLTAIDSDCLGAAYWMREDGEEIVTLLYANGAKKRVCVSADSLSALVNDVLKVL